MSVLFVVRYAEFTGSGCCRDAALMPDVTVTNSEIVSVCNTDI